jgi:hypothetical protein
MVTAERVGARFACSSRGGGDSLGSMFEEKK